MLLPKPSAPRSVLGLVALSALLVACSGDEPAPIPSAPDAAEATDAGFAPPDAGFADTGIVEMADHPFCVGLGLPSVALKPGASTYLFGDVAGDFTATEIGGVPWNLEQNWTGCESYVFVTYIAIANRTTEDEIWRSSIDELLDMPLNSHYFFMSTEMPDARIARVVSMKQRLDAAIDALPVSIEEKIAQKRRFHYISDHPSEVAGSVGAFWQDYNAYVNSPESIVQIDNDRRSGAPLPYFFAIDRDQEWDSGGNTNEFVGGPSSLRMASYLPAFFNHKAALRDAQAVEKDITTIDLINDTVTERVFDRTVALPNAVQMEAFDTLAFDVTVNCPHRNVFSCSEWDRIARIALCLDAECTERRELVRWITPYWRRGERRWVMDASSLFGLLREGGMQRFRIEFGPSWERATARDVRVALRLSDQGKSETSVGVERAFTGGAFDDTYNDREPFSFTPPSTATKVELVVILSGHGQSANTNCAEWCDHRHNFSVNGTALPEIRHIGNIRSAGGCGPAAAQGVPPGQWGNWAPERAYWCPGLPVDHQRIDMTNLVTLGQENVMTYEANYRGQAGNTGGGNISLNTYVVWSE